jgi:hypothetical protein
MTNWVRFFKSSFGQPLFFINDARQRHQPHDCSLAHPGPSTIFSIHAIPDFSAAIGGDSSFPRKRESRG